MEAISTTYLRSNMASSFARADRGEKVLIRRNNQIYALVNVGCEDSFIYSELKSKIESARESFAKGDCVKCSSIDELHAFLDSL